MRTLSAHNHSLDLIQSTLILHQLFISYPTSITMAMAADLFELIQKQFIEGVRLVS
jgi:hypothetical protein